jgi:hypothetical protein
LTFAAKSTKEKTTRTGLNEQRSSAAQCSTQARKKKKSPVALRLGWATRETSVD